MGFQKKLNCAVLHLAFFCSMDLQNDDMHFDAVVVVVVVAAVAII